MQPLSTTRLYLLRAMYLLMAAGLAVQIWPLILNHPADVEHMRGVVRSLLGALSLMALLGLRYPVQLLPVLLFELAWKTIWVLAFGLPLWRAGLLDEGTRETMKACLMGVVLVPLVMPWRYVWAKYVTARGDRWGRQSRTPA